MLLGSLGVLLGTLGVLLGALGVLLGALGVFLEPLYFFERIIPELSTNTISPRRSCDLSGPLGLKRGDPLHVLKGLVEISYNQVRAEISHTEGTRGTRGDLLRLKPRVGAGS